jgi:hypothetical protein
MMARQYKIIASDTTITSRSILSHWGMRFAGCRVIACAFRDPYSAPEGAQVVVNEFTYLGIDWGGG